jgi:hypothetical protein
MSRPFYEVHLVIKMANGQSGSVELSATQLVTKKEIQQVLDRGMRMLDTLAAQEPAEEMRPAANFRVVG